MINWIKLSSLSVITLLLFSSPPMTSVSGANLLDGLAFVGKNGERGGPLDPDEDEEIVFRNGMFTSVSCEPYNFNSSEYSAEAVGDAIHFSAVTESPSHGKISWKGKVVGDTATMEFVWTKERWYWDTRKEYWFMGKLKGK